MFTAIPPSNHWQRTHLRQHPLRAVVHMVMFTTIFVLSSKLAVLGQTLPPKNPEGASVYSAGTVTIQFPPGTPVSEVLEVYQSLTKKRLIRDPSIEAKTVGIETSGQLTTTEAIEFIEKSLLLADIAIVPSGDNMLKVLNTEGAKRPAGEGVPVILRENDLPESDQIVSFVLPLQHLSAENAAQTFAQIIPPHVYGIVTAIPNARALHITENTSTIRAYIALAKQVDVPASETQHQSFHLKRATADEVADQLTNLLGLNKTGAGTAGGSSPGAASRPAAPRMSTPAQNPAGNPQQAAAQQAAQINVTPVLGSTAAEAPPPIIQPIARTNSVLVVARPLDLKYIETLVAELDSESPHEKFISRKLDYMDLRTFLEIAEKALLRHNQSNSNRSLQQQSNLGGNDMNGSTTGFTNHNHNNNSNLNNRFGGGLGGNDSFGGAGGFGDMGGLGGGGMGGSGASGNPMNVTVKAFSVVVANTLVVVDPASSTFYASGPPEQLRILNELADTLDVRPKQILLTTVIGEFSLGDDFRFGLDWIRTIDNVGNNNLIGGVLQTQGASYANPSTMRGVEDFLPALDGLTVYGQIGKNLSAFMQTLESSDRFKVLQRPTVTTLNHETAVITIGQRIPYAGQSLTVANTNDDNASVRSTIDFINASLQVRITPHIFNENEVHLEFDQMNSNVTGFTTIDGNPVPNQSVQTMNNRIIVPDRTTVMLGGLIDERNTNNKNGLPFLVRVPILKHLFGNTAKTKDRRELLIFITPRILHDGPQHLNEQSDFAKDIISYPEVKEFANPNESNPLLPLPDWPEKLPSNDSPSKRRK